MPAKQGSEVIPGRHSHTSVVHNNALWVFGGYDNRERKNDFWKWDFGKCLKRGNIEDSEIGRV